jgi:DMSO/TMAO reductase YedYZ molybdopterin-dependent catalytic subunit
MPAANSIAPITRSTSPLVVEFAFAESAEQTTPNDRFFVRNHFPVPAVDPLSWNVRIEGALEAPCTVSLAALREMSAVTVSVVLECAGNGRAFMQGNASSIQWQLGGVGCATFTGVPLRDVLAHTRLPEDAVDVVFEGADHGPEHKIPGRADIHFARSVPLAIAMRPDVILAYEMNGQPLEPDHGAPLRVIVPGWYGVASVKWLSRIIIATRPFTGYFQSAEYTYWKEAGESGMERVPVTTRGPTRARIWRSAFRTASSVPRGRAMRRSSPLTSAPTAASRGSRPPSAPRPTRMPGSCGRSSGRRRPRAAAPSWRGPRIQRDAFSRWRTTRTTRTTWCTTYCPSRSELAERSLYFMLAVKLNGICTSCRTFVPPIS